MTLGGRAVDVAALIGAAADRFGAPQAVAADRWRSGELMDGLESASVAPAALSWRGQGYRDGGEDVRAFRRACLESRVVPMRSLLLTSAMSESIVVSDPAGNAKLSKRRSRARDDAAAAAILAVAEGSRRAQSEQTTIIRPGDPEFFEGEYGMTARQKIELRRSEIRSRLGEIAGLEGDALTTEVRGERDGLMTELTASEPQLRAAISAEETETRHRGEQANGDGETVEVRALMGRVHLGEYLGRAAAGTGVAGAPVELAAALKVPTVGASGVVAVPWEALAGPEPRSASGFSIDNPESRAFTTTAAYGGGVMQRPILQRLFGMDLMMALGVRIDAVPAGRSEWPLITGGVAPDQAVEGTAAANAVTAAFSTETLKPKRLTGRYEYTHEMGGQVLELEAALRRDLADSVKARMSALILLGDENADPQEPDGFYRKLAAPGDPAATSGYSDYASTAAAAVDGIHASMEGEVGCVIGTASYRHAAGVYQAGSGESGTEALAKRSMLCMASSFVPAPVGNTMIQKGNIVHAAGPNGGGAELRGDSVAAVWPTLELIRDIYTKASQGVVLTWVTLWDAETAFRADAYKRVAYRLAYQPVDEVSGD